MKAVVCHRTELTVADLPDPEPQRGQLLLGVRRCGICGSDLHARRHADELQAAAAAAGYDNAMGPEDRVVLGHEFVGEVVETRGPRRGLRLGDRVVALPLLRREGAVQATGLSPLAPGAYAERVLVEASLAMPVPNGLPDDHAALTEPMAVGLHAVRRGEVGAKQVAIVIGCGPIGLAVISMLKATGVRTVVASDYSAERRALATTCGADVVVDPVVTDPWRAYDTSNYHTRAGQLFDLALGSMEKLRRIPLPWWQVMRAAEAAGAMPQGPVVFECVGVPGVIDEIVTRAPLASRVVVVGVTMEPDTIRPSIAINKEIDLRFVLGYTPREFRESLHLLAEGAVDAGPLVTGRVGLGGVAAAFDALSDPVTGAGEHAKVLVEPGRAGEGIAPA